MAYTPKLTYKGRPLVRCGNDIYYGSMKDPFVVYLQVLSTKKENGVDVADKVHIVLLSTDESKPLPERIARQACTTRCPSATSCCRAHCRKSKKWLNQKTACLRIWETGSFFNRSASRIEIALCR